MQQDGLLRTWPLVVLALSIASSQTVLAQGMRLHDAEKEKIAREAAESFKTLTTKEANVFAAMLRNLEAIHQRDLDILRQRNQATLDSTVNNLVLANWGTLLAEVRKQQSRFLQGYHEIAQELRESETQVAELKSAVSDARRRVAEKAEALKERRKELEGSPATLKQFEEAIQKLRTTGEIGSLEDLKKLQQVPDSVKELKKLVDALPQTTGLELVLLDLGLGLARIELEREKEELEYREWLVDGAKERLDRLENVVGLDAETASVTECNQNAGEDLKFGEFGKIYEYIRPKQELGCKNRFGAAMSEEILVTIGRLARNAQQEPIEVQELVSTRSLRNLMDVLARYASLVGYQHFMLEAEDIETATREVRHSIRLSAINAREHEVLIAHGLQGLAIYHEGGLRPEEIANLIRAAQTIATTVIAARVN